MNSINNNNIAFNGGTNRYLAKAITGMTKADAMPPIVALEACVVTGRTYQAYKRGKWDEARERFIEEIIGSIVWLCGVASMNKLGDKLVSRILNSNGKNFDVGTDKILRTPFENFMKKLSSKKFTPTQVAGIKSAKVLTSILITNLFIGFVVPKLNQGLTKKLRHERKVEQQHNKQNSNPTFKGGAMNAVNAFTNIIENTNTGKLLSSDVGIAGGRMYNARTKEERREIAIRDIGSIYFYMWARGHVGNLMNLAESGHARRLNPNTAAILDNHLNKFLDKKGEMSVEEFRKAVLGNKVSEIKLPENMKFETEKVSGLSKLFNTQPLEVIKLSEAEKLFKDSEILQRLKDMSTLQPPRQGESILTKQQVIDAVNKAEINNTELLHNVFSEFTEGVGKEIGKDAKGKPIRSEVEFVGGKYNDEFRFVSNKKLYKLKSDMEQYVETICNAAKDGKVDKKLLEKIKNKNLMYNGLNFVTGFAIAAAFLSTFIPKIQYYVTKRATGVDAFPGVYDFEKGKEVEDDYVEEESII